MDEDETPQPRPKLPPPPNQRVIWTPGRSAKPTPPRQETPTDRLKRFFQEEQEAASSAPVDPGMAGDPQFQTLMFDIGLATDGAIRARRELVAGGFSEHVAEQVTASVYGNLMQYLANRRIR